MAETKIRGHKDAHNDLTAEELRRVLHYDPETGIFTWQVSRPPRGRIGQQAGWVAHYKTGVRIKIAIGGREYMAHRLAWLYETGEWPEFEVDHKDLNGANNTWDNLRAATPSQNLSNRGPQRNNKTGYKGVCFDNTRKLFLATINVHVDGHKRHIHIGHFQTAEEAYAAYCAAAQRIHKDFSRVL